MNRLNFVRTLGAAIVMAGAVASPALAAPSATINFHGGSAAFIVGARWGSGSLHYHGHSYPLKVGGISVGAVGASSYNFTGTVSNLHRLNDINGTYAAVDASATVGVGSGKLWLKNGNGVEINATANNQGLKFSLAPTGLTISLK